METAAASAADEDDSDSRATTPTRYVHNITQLGHSHGHTTPELSIMSRDLCENAYFSLHALGLQFNQCEWMIFLASFFFFSLLPPVPVLGFPLKSSYVLLMTSLSICIRFLTLTCSCFSQYPPFYYVAFTVINVATLQMCPKTVLFIWVFVVELRMKILPFSRTFWIIVHFNTLSTRLIFNILFHTCSLYQHFKSCISVYQPGFRHQHLCWIKMN